LVFSCFGRNEPWESDLSVAAVSLSWICTFRSINPLSISVCHAACPRDRSPEVPSCSREIRERRTCTRSSGHPFTNLSHIDHVRSFIARSPHRISNSRDQFRIRFIFPYHSRIEIYALLPVPPYLHFAHSAFLPSKSPDFTSQWSIHAH
jgi:hypothetical protein